MWLKFEAKDSLFFLVQRLVVQCIMPLQDIKYCMVPVPGRTIRHTCNKLIQFPVCAHVGVLYSLEILPLACEKPIQI